MATFDDFMKLDIRVGTIINACNFGYFSSTTVLISLLPGTE